MFMKYMVKHNLPSLVIEKRRPLAVVATAIPSSIVFRRTAAVGGFTIGLLQPFPVGFRKGRSVEISGLPDRPLKKLHPALAGISPVLGHRVLNAPAHGMFRAQPFLLL